MAKRRKLWAFAHGGYREKVRIYEPKAGAALRWDYREAGGRRRPEVQPQLRVRHSAAEPPDPTLVRKAENLCRAKAHELNLGILRRESEPEALTVGRGFSLYHSPRRRALPPSPQAQRHHRDSRDFWERELGAGTLWDAVTPADVRGALIRLKESGRVATAEKRLRNLRTLYRWLRDDMAMDRLRDPTRGIKVREITAGYAPARPRYSSAEAAAMLAAAPAFGPRLSLFAVLLFDSGARGGQVRLVYRGAVHLESGNGEPVPVGHAPFGWALLPAVKEQAAMLTYLTERQRAALDCALASYLAPLEAEYQASGADYPLFPAGRLDRGELGRTPMGDRALRYTWDQLEAAAKIAPRARTGFHSARRRWVDDIQATEGLDVAAHAGGWSSREMVENVYVSPRRFDDLERARKAREREV